MNPASQPGTDAHDDDVKVLHSMGYAQELARNMKGFQNFAISFSIICILSGGINSLAQGTSGAGGAAIGIVRGRGLAASGKQQRRHRGGQQRSGHRPRRRAAGEPVHCSGWGRGMRPPVHVRADASRAWLSRRCRRPAQRRSADTSRPPRGGSARNARSAPGRRAATPRCSRCWAPPMAATASRRLPCPTLGREFP